MRPFAIESHPKSAARHRHSKWHRKQWHRRRASDDSSRDPIRVRPHHLIWEQKYPCTDNKTGAGAC